MRFGQWKPGSQLAMNTLIKLYAERSDLQEVYPEAKEGDYARLIDWAAGASASRFEDSSYPVLRPYAGWYAANVTGVQPRVPCSVVRKTSSAAATPMPTTLDIMQDETSVDISYHLPSLSLLVTEFELRNIVELGVLTGHSTVPGSGPGRPGSSYQGPTPRSAPDESVDTPHSCDAGRRAAREGRNASDTGPTREPTVSLSSLTNTAIGGGTKCPAWILPVARVGSLSESPGEESNSSKGLTSGPNGSNAPTLSEGPGQLPTSCSRSGSSYACPRPRWRL
jgi:hypothetical protein